MVITLLGFDFACPNKGCEALTYSVIAMLRKLFPDEKLEIHTISAKTTLGVFPSLYTDIEFVNHKMHLKSPAYLMEIKKLFSKSDAVLDITYGDSFSDLYGKKWLCKTNMHKQIAIWSKANLVLMPQTYGPFEQKMLKKWSLRIIKDSNYVFSRDHKSADFLKAMGIDDVNVVTDLAMILPYDSERYATDNGKINVGINISSLLWEGGFTGNNEFGLTVDYQKFNLEIIEALLKDGRYSVHLIPHVIENTPDARENDCRALDAVKALFPQVILAPELHTPIEIKSYISNMDIFIGARMHATIAAFSSGVPVIPFAYSRKFAGLFENLDYNYVIDGRSLDTPSAIARTLEYIEKRGELISSQQKAKKRVDELIAKFYADFKACFNRSLEH